MNDKENVALIIVTENNAETIERAIESASNNSRPPDQITICDNDSKDGTYDKLCQLLGAQKVTIDDKTGWPPQFDGVFNNIPTRILRKRHSTTGHTLNIAMQSKWQGVTIFAFLEPDGWYEPEKIQKCVNIFSDNSSVACVVNDSIEHHENGSRLRVFKNSFDMHKIMSDFEYDGSFMVRTQVFPKIKSGFNEQLPVMHEYELLIKISSIGLIYHIPEALHHTTIENRDIRSQKNIEKCKNTIRQALQNG